MKNSIKNIAALISATVLFNACETSFTEPKHSAGNADFTRYVALGNSLTAGYTDGALSYDGQKNAYPSILAGQFQKVGGATVFNVPYLTGDNGAYGVSPAAGFGAVGFPTTPAYTLQYTTDCLGETSVGPAIDLTKYTANNLAFLQNVYLPGIGFNNLGVPGAKSFDLLRHDLGVLGATMNPYYLRFASNTDASGTSNVVSDALQISPTFFTLWIGNNDVLGYATSGGSGMVGGYNPNDITAESVFDTSIVTIVKQMTANGAKGVIGNIPDVTSIPYFTTVPYNGLTISNAADTAALNAGYAVYNAGAQALGLPSIKFTIGANAFVINDASAQYAALGGIRQIKKGEYLTLTVPQDSIKCAGWGSQKGIPTQYVLDANEVNNVKTYTTKFNNWIKKVASDYNLAFADFNTFFNTVQAGITFNGATYTPVFARGGMFGLDGVHPTQRGYALIANYYIDIINAHYSSDIPKVDVNSFKGVQFP